MPDNGGAHQALPVPCQPPGHSRAWHTLLSEKEPDCTSSWVQIETVLTNNREQLLGVGVSRTRATTNWDMMMHKKIKGYTEPAWSLSIIRFKLKANPEWLLKDEFVQQITFVKRTCLCKIELWRAQE